MLNNTKNLFRLILLTLMCSLGCNLLLAEQAELITHPYELEQPIQKAQPIQKEYVAARLQHNQKIRPITKHRVLFKPFEHWLFSWLFRVIFGLFILGNLVRPAWTDKAAVVSTIRSLKARYQAVSEELSIQEAKIDAMPISTQEEQNNKTAHQKDLDLSRQVMMFCSLSEAVEPFNANGSLYKSLLLAIEREAAHTAKSTANPPMVQKIMIGILGKLSPSPVQINSDMIQTDLCQKYSDFSTQQIQDMSSFVEQDFNHLLDTYEATPELVKDKIKELYKIDTDRTLNGHVDKAINFIQGILTVRQTQEALRRDKIEALERECAASNQLEPTKWWRFFRALDLKNRPRISRLQDSMSNRPKLTTKQLWSSLIWKPVFMFQVLALPNIDEPKLQSLINEKREKLFQERLAASIEDKRYSLSDDELAPQLPIMKGFDILKESLHTAVMLRAATQNMRDGSLKIRLSDADMTAADVDVRDILDMKKQISSIDTWSFTKAENNWDAYISHIENGYNTWHGQPIPTTSYDRRLAFPNNLVPLTESP